MTYFDRSDAPVKQSKQLTMIYILNLLLSMKVLNVIFQPIRWFHF